MKRVNNVQVNKSIDIATQQKIKDFDRKLFSAVLVVDATAKRNLQSGSRTGRLYRRRSITHQASAPGEYPKTDTGKLVQSIFVERLGPLKYLVGSRGSGAPHGKWLEFGTVNMRARPWLSRAVRESWGKMKSIIGGK